MAFVDYASVDAEAASGRVYSVFCDQLGMPRYIEDAHGNVVWFAERVTAFGRLDALQGKTRHEHSSLRGTAQCERSASLARTGPIVDAPQQQRRTAS